MLFESDELAGFIKLLNTEDLAPKGGFRRNKSIYELVCYVNNNIGCYMSKCVKPIPIFISRIRIYLAESTIAPEDEEYCIQVSKFVGVLENHLESNGVSCQW